jgi:flavodoxin short chain
VLRTIVIYWTGTGNTQILAEAITKNLKVNNIDITIKNVGELHQDFFNTDYDIYILGCPAMGIEALEEDEFRPFFEKLKPHLNNKPLALFGSYAWGWGEWMKKWIEECLNVGAILMTEALIVKSTPSAHDLKCCEDFCKNIERMLVTYA